MNIGPYAVIGELGRGGMGVVYRARHGVLGHEVALKVIAPGKGADPESAARFLREGRAAARLAGHPHIVGVRDVGEGFVASDGTDGGAAHDARPVLYLAMDLVEGQSLADRLDEEGPLPVAEALAIGEAVALALAHAHAHGVLHRDVKPDNVLLGRQAGTVERSELRVESRPTAPPGANPAQRSTLNPQPRPGAAFLADFGLARVEAAGPEVSRLTQSGFMVGTPAYMAPEQARGETVDARADVYGLGATLYACFAGAPPFGDGTVVELVTALLRQPPPPLRTRNAEVPADLAVVIHRCLAKDPADRYPTADALAADLARMRRGESPAFRAPGGSARLVAAVRRRPAMVAVVALAVAGVGAAAIAVATGTRRARAGAADLRGTEDARALAERGAAAAAIYRALAKATREPMLCLEDHFLGMPVPAAEVAAARTVITAAVERLARAHPGHSLPPAWGRLADSLAGEVVEPGLPVPDDPLVTMVRARVPLARWIHGLRVPDLTIGARTTTHLAVHFGRMKETPAQRAARTAAADLLRVAAASPMWTHLPEAGDLLALATGASALVAGELDAALRLLTPLRDDPLLGVQAREMLALAHMQRQEFAAAAALWEVDAARGRLHACYAAGWCHTAHALSTETPTEATAAYARAERWLGRAFEIGGPLPDLLLVRAASRWQRGLARANAGADPTADVTAALVDLDQALAATPDWLAARLMRAAALRARAQWSREAPARSASDLERAMADATAAVAIAPDDPTPHHELAQAWQTVAERREEAGADPCAAYRTAVDALDAALARFPEMPNGYRQRATAWLGWGKSRTRRGEDPGDAAVRAAADLDTALRLEPSDVDAWCLRAKLRLDTAKAAAGAGAPLAETFREALADADAAVALEPTFGRARQGRGAVLEAWGLAEIMRGADGRPRLREALAEFDAAVTCAPADARPVGSRGLVRLALARAEADAGGDPTAGLAAALADLAEAARRLPEHIVAQTNLALVHQAEADLAEAAGGDPEPATDRALAVLDAALRLSPDAAQPRFNRGALRFARAGRRVAQGEPAEDDVRAALEDFAAAARVEPGDWRAHDAHGRALEVLGREAEALQAVETALALRPGEPDLLERQARLRAAVAGRGPGPR